jgi:cell wall-associated NlpC family hydrolase
MKPYPLILGLMLLISITARAQADDDAASTNSTPKSSAAPANSSSVSTNQVANSDPVDSTNSAPSFASPKTAPAPLQKPAPVSHVATLSPSDLREFEAQSPSVKKLLTEALNLTTLNLSYKYGCSDPKDGGMDCSGTVYYLLISAGLKDVPRDASGMYKLHSQFRAVVSSNLSTFELAPLKPGDLLFWTGTYHVDRDPPVTHVMIYLGINRHTNRQVMVGASEGRRFNGKSQYGVSVFDFTLPGKSRQPDSGSPATNDLKSQFIGYGAIPGLGDIPSGDNATK